VEKRLKEFGAFCRSLLPADWGQLLLLAGCYLLFMSWGLWWGPNFVSPARGEATNVAREAALAAKLSHWLLLSRLALLPVLWAGAAGYWLFFWGAARAVRRLIHWVILPGCAGILAVLCASMIFFGAGDSDVEQGLLHVTGIWPLLPTLTRGLGSGLHAALIGLVLVSVAARRVARGLSALPTTGAIVAEAPASGAEDQEISELKRFAWAVLSLWSLLATVLVFLAPPLIERVLGLLLRGRVPDHWLIEMVAGSHRVLSALPLTLIAVWLMGSERWKTLVELLTPRRWGILALALAIPLLIHWIPKIVFLLAARIHWATYTHDVEFAPAMRDYLEPGRWQWDLLRFPAAALLSELAWRGYALRRFVAGFGAHRGIVLLGIFWGAMTLRHDWLPVEGDAGVLIALASSILWGVAVSYPLAWVTLRSASVLPAVVVMGVQGMLSQMQKHEPRMVQGWLASPYLEVVLWALVGIVLFRWFGVAAQAPPTIERPDKT
jgi:membrane protease YdiL (CAAX protease family)